jgi:Zn-dependent alcohol dehydrogenase
MGKELGATHIVNSKEQANMVKATKEITKRRRDVHD